MAKKSRKSKHANRRTKRRRSAFLRYAVIAMVVIGAGAAWVLTRPPAAPPVADERVAVEHSQGPQDAPVTIFEYGDFNCPSCRAYHQAGIIEQVLQTYPDQIRFVWRHFPVITPDSPRLAQAAECAADQDAFWEFHDLAFQDAPNRPDDMPPLAEATGLDMQDFNTCYDSHEYGQLVEEQTRQGFALGLRGTPSFQINDTVLAGPPSYDQWVGLVNQMLASQP